MKVILLRDVAKIGKRFEIVDVPDGYALNKLIPRKDAEAAIPVNVKRVLNMRQKGLSDKEGVIVAIKKMVADLSETPLQVPMQANEQGHLFQSVHASDVVEAAEKVKLIGEKLLNKTIQLNVTGTEPAATNNFNISLDKLKKIGFTEDDNYTLETEIEQLFNYLQTK